MSEQKPHQLTPGSRYVYQIGELKLALAKESERAAKAEVLAAEWEIRARELEIRAVEGLSLKEDIDWKTGIATMPPSPPLPVPSPSVESNTKEKAPLPATNGVAHPDLPVQEDNPS